MTTNHEMIVLYSNHAKILCSTLIVAAMALLFSCADFIDIPPPKNDLTRTTVFAEDATALAAAADIYYQLISTGFANGGQSSITVLSALSSDELTNHSSGALALEFQQFNENAIAPGNSQLPSLWNVPYTVIYKCNAMLEGLAGSDNVSQTVKHQLTGEAKFIRAFSHFYLVNLFGDIPLILTTDYRSNTTAPRTPKDVVYQQIIADLEEAGELLADDYSASNDERVKPNRWAAEAMLARLYLYTGEWQKAALHASLVIDNNVLYSLENNASDVFLKESKESIWQLLTATARANTLEGNFFIFSGAPVYTALRNDFVERFEAGDQRAIVWIGTTNDGTTTYYYPHKYKEPTGTNPPTEYSVVLRLAEQYLIRAEAKVRLGAMPEAIADVDRIRQRAGLPLVQDVAPGVSAEQLLAIIEQERSSEFFTEWGHRWLDLKRTGRANDVLGPLKLNWQPTAVLYPIPQEQILRDPAMANAQNPGY